MRYVSMVLCGTVFTTVLATGAMAQNVQTNFGVDDSEWSDNGVCDDRRFDGTGTADTRGWRSVGQDATDCRAAVESGAAHLWTVAQGIADQGDAAVDFGDNSSEYSDDGACDDPRFEGHGATENPNMEGVGHDKNDCGQLFEFGTLFLRDVNFAALPEPEMRDPLYGDNSGSYPSDGECDDRRFVGDGMASSLTWAMTGKDANDCRAKAEAGAITLWDRDAAVAKTVCSAVDWGSDSSDYANDGTCDDYRFEGLGSAGQISQDNSLSDATDCQRMCDYGLLFLREYE